MRGIISPLGGARLQVLRRGRVLRREFWPMLIFVSALTMRFASGVTANVSFFLLAAYALSGRAQAIQSLALGWLFSMLSGGEKGGIAPPATQAAIGRYIVIAAAALSILIRNLLSSSKGQVSLPTLSTWLFGAFIFSHSCLFSTDVEISLLKSTVWAVTFLTLLSAWENLSVESRQQLQAQLIGLLVAILLCSLPLVFLSVGYVANNSGFQGILNQPQGFGPVMALLGSFVIIGLLAKPQPLWRDLTLAVACLVMVIMSQARTAGLALVLGVVIAVIVAPMLMRHSKYNALPGLRNTKMLLMLFLLTLCALVGLALGEEEKLAKILDSYLSKGGGTSNLSEAYQNSRGGLMAAMWDNIVSQPFTGIGFGVASTSWDMDIITRDPYFGLPLGAPIEKGVLPLAVLEELGIPGFVLFLGWLGILIQRAGRRGVLELALAATVFLINFGESTLMSPSGLGMILLIVLTWAVALPKQPSNVSFRA